MAITLTPSGREKIGSPHKAPHFGKSFRSTLYTGYRKSHDCRQVLKSLLSSIQSGTFKLFFEAGEIEALFKKEVLLKYAGGRYYYHEKLDSYSGWADFLNNRAASILAARDFIKNKTQSEYSELIEATKDAQSSLRELKIAEDWLYFHREVLEKTISEFESTRK